MYASHFELDASPEEGQQLKQKRKGEAKTEKHKDARMSLFRPNGLSYTKYPETITPLIPKEERNNFSILLCGGSKASNITLEKLS